MKNNTKPNFDNVTWLKPNRLRPEIIAMILGVILALLFPIIIAILGIKEYGLNKFYIETIYILGFDIIMSVILYYIVNMRIMSFIKNLGVDNSIIIIETYKGRIYYIDSDRVVYTTQGFFVDKYFFTLSTGDFSFEQLVKYIYPLLSEGRYIYRSEISDYMKSL